MHASLDRIRESHDLAGSRPDRVITTDRRFVRFNDDLGHARSSIGQGRPVPVAANNP